MSYLIQCSKDKGRTWEFYSYAISDSDLEWFKHRVRQKPSRRFPYPFRIVRDGEIIATGEGREGN